MLGFVHNLNGQNNCSSAINILPANNCNFTSHTTSSQEYWLNFNATSEYVNITIETTEFGLDEAHIHGIELYSGSCGNLNLLADDELAFVPGAKILRVDLNASNLLIGQEYFIKVSRTSLVSGRTCDKSSCTQNNSTDPTDFDICVEEVNVVIPPDFSGDEPTVENAFFVNKGQLRKTNGSVANEIKMYTRNAVPNTYIGEDKLSYVFSKVDTANELDLTHRIDMELVNSITRPIFKTEELPAYSNFYDGHSERGAVRNRSYNRTVSNNVYEKIDFHSYSNSGGIKHYFVINPGGNPDDININFQGADSIEITNNGGLKINSSLGILEFNPPTAYKVNPGGNTVPMPWQAEFFKVSSNTVALDIRQYSPNMPLFIQIERSNIPKTDDLVEWSTFFGGGSDDFGADITHDDIGNIYVTGQTYSNNFPLVNAQSFQQGFGGGSDAFIAKFNEFYEPEWVTYLGGSLDDVGVSIAYSDIDNFVYTATIDNETSTNFTAPLLTFESNPNGYNDANRKGTYISRFNAVDGFIEWGTYFGATFTFAYDIDVSNSGDLYVVGNSSVSGVNLTCNPSNEFSACNSNGVSFTQISNNGGFAFGDGFIARFSPNTELTWSTLIGGADSEIFRTVAFDNRLQRVFVGGYTSSSRNNSPTCNPSSELPICGSNFVQDQLKGSSDGYFLAFNSDNQLVHSSYFGGSGQEQISDIAINSNSDVYFISYSNSSNGASTCLPSSGGWMPNCSQPFPAFSENNSGLYDTHIARFDENFNLTWTTFFGGQLDEIFGNFSTAPRSTAQAYIDENNDRLFLLGNSESGSNGTNSIQTINSLTNIYYQEQHGDESSSVRSDAYVAVFSSANERQYGSYFGGIDSDEVGGITVLNDRIYLTGGSKSNQTTFPLNCPDTPMPYCQSINSGSYDAFLAQIRLTSITLSIEDFGTTNADMDLNNLVVYPNPTTDMIRLNLLNNENLVGGEIICYNLAGKVVKKWDIKDLASTISVSDLSSGTYVLSVQSDQEVYKTKFIKQ